MITFNLVNFIILILGIIIIWKSLYEEYTKELGALIGIIIELIWVIAWIVIFPVLGHGILIDISFY